MKKQLLTVLLASIAFSHTASAAVSPSALKAKIYKFSVSTDEYCTNPITVFNNAAPEYTDFAAGPSIGSGSLAKGTYKCVILEVSDTFKYTPATDEGSCDKDTEVSKDVCRSSQTTKLADGTSTDCTAAENRMAIYISTASTLDGTDETYDAAGCNTGTDCNSLLPPSATLLTRGVKLGAALTVSADMTGSFVIDLTNALDGSGGTCSFENVKFSFK